MMSRDHAYHHGDAVELIQDSIMQAQTSAAVPADVVVSVGMFALAWFIVRSFRVGRTQAAATVALNYRSVGQLCPLERGFGKWLAMPIPLSYADTGFCKVPCGRSEIVYLLLIFSDQTQSISR